MSAELKPCDWCGGKGEYRQTYTVGCGFGSYQSMGPCEHCNGTGRATPSSADSVAAAPVSVAEGELPELVSVAWRRATKHSWEYRNTAPTASTPGTGWIALCNLDEARAAIAADRARFAGESIDADGHFSAQLDKYDDEASYGSLKKARAVLIAHIDAKLAAARRAAGSGAVRDGQEVEASIPQGWLFNTADFSCLAHGSRMDGTVMLVRDAAGRAEFHALPDDSPEREAFQLYVGGNGKTIRAAIANAVANIATVPSPDAPAGGKDGA